MLTFGDAFLLKTSCIIVEVVLVKEFAPELVVRELAVVHTRLCQFLNTRTSVMTSTP